MENEKIKDLFPEEPPVEEKQDDFALTEESEENTEFQQALGILLHLY